MPGRPSVRASRAAVTTGNPSSKATTSAKTRSASSRLLAFVAEPPEEGAPTALRERICGIFSDAQRGAVTQRKSAVNLRKIQELCSYETAAPRKHAFAGDASEFDESDFNEEIGRCVVRILYVKKSEPVGDRLIRFLGLFLKHASDKGTF